MRSWPKVIITFQLCDKLLINYDATRKSTGLKSLRVNCWEINHVTSNYQMDILDKTCKIRYKTEKVNIPSSWYQISLGTKFHFKQILNSNLPKKGISKQKRKK